MHSSTTEHLVITLNVLKPSSLLGKSPFICPEMKKGLLWVCQGKALQLGPVPLPSRAAGGTIHLSGDRPHWDICPGLGLGSDPMRTLCRLTAWPGSCPCKTPGGDPPPAFLTDLASVSGWFCGCTG